MNTISRKSQKIIKKPWFIKELIAEKTYLISKDDENQLLMLKDPEVILVEHRNLQTPELQGDDGIIVDIEKKTVKYVNYQIYRLSPSIYEVTQQLRYVYQLDESYLKWILNQMVDLLKYTHCKKTMTCKGISKDNLQVERDGTLKLFASECKRNINQCDDTRPEDIRALGNMIIELYFNVPEYKNYFSTSELYFSEPLHWKKLSMLSATFGQAPMPIS